uniref:Uncharacterized protein n=1 Tax=Arundo donax TaxID=35708 RepID=A0A0A9DWF3_ARUDO
MVVRRLLLLSRLRYPPYKVEWRREVGEGEELVEGAEARARAAHLGLQLRRGCGLLGRCLLCGRRVIDCPGGRRRRRRRGRAPPARGGGGAGPGGRGGVGGLYDSIAILGRRQRRRRLRGAEGGCAGDDVQQPPHVLHCALLVVLLFHQGDSGWLQCRNVSSILQWAISRLMCKGVVCEGTCGRIDTQQPLHIDDPVR